MVSNRIRETTVQLFCSPCGNRVVCALRPSFASICYSLLFFAFLYFCFCLSHLLYFLSLSLYSSLSLSFSICPLLGLSFALFLFFHGNIYVCLLVTKPFSIFLVSCEHLVFLQQTSSNIGRP